jgi:ferredoxin--NADP+ reductase
MRAFVIAGASAQSQFFAPAPALRGATTYAQPAVGYDQSQYAEVYAAGDPRYAYQPQYAYDVPQFVYETPADESNSWFGSNWLFLLGGSLMGYAAAKNMNLATLAVAGWWPDDSWRSTYNGKPKPAAPARTTANQMAEATAEPATTTGKQDFLEAEPYWDQSTVPVNTYKTKEPFEGTVRSVKRIVGPNATGETCDIVIEHNGKMPYWEGQSYGIIPAGENPKKPGKPNAVRLYSIASSRYGDDMTGDTATLCVRRATYWCPELQAEDPAKKGICSNFLCDAQPGDKLMMTGPSGKVMLMPEKDPNIDLIMVATGTGIAPYRGMIRRLFTEKTPAGEAYKGLAWLFLGVANTDALLYDEEWQEVLKNNPDNFRLDYAISREQQNKDGGKMYIQDKVEEYADEIVERLEKGAHMYFCGLKGMMPGINEMLKKVCEKKGLDFEEFTKGLKKNGQWHVEVY